MKKSIVLGFVTGFLAFSAHAAVWFADGEKISKIIHATCEIIVDPDLYENSSVENIEFLEELKAHNFHLLRRRPEDMVGPYLFVKKMANDKIFLGKEDSFGRYFEDIPFCETEN